MLRSLPKVSTRQKDFLLDPFEIFEQMHLLNEANRFPSVSSAAISSAMIAMNYITISVS